MEVNNSQPVKRILQEAQGEFNPSGLWIFVYYVAIPLLVPIGLVGNILCIKVVLQKFSKEIGFVYQALIMVVDSLTLVFILLQVSGLHWGVGSGVVERKLAMRTAYWFEQSFIRQFLLQNIFDPIRQVGSTLSIFLLVGVGIDRIFALAKPLYYKNMMNRKLAFVLIALTSLVLSIPVGVNQSAFLAILEVPVNTSTHGVISVYKRVSIKGARDTGFAQVMQVLDPLIRLGNVAGVICISIAVVILYTRYAKHSQGTGPSRSGTGSQHTTSSVRRHNPGIVPVDHKLLTKLMLVQCVMVCMSAIPSITLRVVSHVRVSFGVRLVSIPVMKVLAHISNLGYTAQVSLNVLVYAGVSNRFRQALHSVVCCKNQVADSHGPAPAEMR